MSEQPIEQLGMYNVFEQIGHGGFSMIYRAENAALKKIVAIKLLRTDMFHDPEAIERFIREARTAAALNHERIVRVLDLDQDDARLYMALEYLPNGDLKHWMETRGRLTFRQIAGILSDIAEALDYAHGKGIVHGDVKPGNILIAADDRAKLGDFGVLRAVEQSGVISADMIAGTPYYTAPEQAEGTRSSARSDQYSLGVVAYELFTGQVPFGGETPTAIYLKHIKDQPAPLSQFNSLVTPGLEAAVLRALEKDPEKRYASCSEFARAVREAVAETEREQFQKLIEQVQDALAAHDTPGARPLLQDALQIMPDDAQARELLARLETQERAQRNYTEAAAALDSARKRAAELRTNAPELPDPPEIVRRLVPPALPAWKRITGKLKWSVIIAAILVLLLTSFGLLWFLKPVDKPEQNNSKALAAKIVGYPFTETPTLTFTPLPTATLTPSLTPTLTPTNTPTPTPTATLTPTFTPTFTFTPTPTQLGGGSGKIAFVSTSDGNYEIYVLDITNYRYPTRLTENSAYDDFPAWSPDGQKIAFVSNRDADGEIYVMNADGSDQTRLTNSPGDDTLPSWSPDGKYILFVSARNKNYDIYVMNADGSNPRQLTSTGNDETYPTWSPDGKRIAYQMAINNRWIIYVMGANGSYPTPLTYDLGDARDPSWSPDNKYIAFTSGSDGDYEIYIIEADGSNLTQLTKNDSFYDGVPNWSPDGKHITFTSYRDANGGGEIYIMNADGSNPFRLTNNPAYDGKPAWSP